MGFKSKEEMRKWGELVKEGKLTQDQYNKAINTTEDVHSLPERLNVQHPKIPKVGKVGFTKVIK